MSAGIVCVHEHEDAPYFLKEAQVLPAAGLCRQFHGREACCSLEYTLAVESKVRGLQHRAASLRGPCVDRVFRLYTGVACSVCDPHWRDYAVAAGGRWVLRVREENCAYVWDACEEKVPHMSQEAFCAAVGDVGPAGFFDALTNPALAGPFALPNSTNATATVFHHHRTTHHRHVERPQVEHVVHERKVRASRKQQSFVQARPHKLRGLVNMHRDDDTLDLGDAQEPETEPETTEPEATEPEATESEATEPEATGAAEADAGAAETTEPVAEAEAEDVDTEEPATEAEDGPEAALSNVTNGTNATNGTDLTDPAALQAEVAKVEEELARRAAEQCHGLCQLPVPRLEFDQGAQLSAVDEGDFAGYSWPAPSGAPVLFLLALAA